MFYAFLAGMEIPIKYEQALKQSKTFCLGVNLGNRTVWDKMELTTTTSYCVTQVAQIIFFLRQEQAQDPGQSVKSGELLPK